MSGNQPIAAWAGPGDPLNVVAGHLVSPQDEFGEIGRMANGDLRRPNRIAVGAGGAEIGGPISALIGTSNLPILTLEAENNISNVGMSFLTDNINAAARNWAILFNTVVFGDFAIRQSNARLGNPITAGTDVFHVAPNNDITIIGNFLFPDNTRDIGASGATRPRDLFLSRNLTMGGTALAADGLVGTPSYAFANDPNTGIFSFAADEGALVANGAGSVRWDNGVGANEMRIILWDVTAAAWKRVRRGAVDSGGAGLRTLLIDN